MSALICHCHSEIYPGLVPGKGAQAGAFAADPYKSAAVVNAVACDSVSRNTSSFQNLFGAVRGQTWPAVDGRRGGISSGQKRQEGTAANDGDH